ncbi:hypothetical protein [Jeotgalibacillus terrae]|uniref:Uncharacterized protein n=1 Tax=Jeotgalibacillus terrae TaxID=587735 RepID=A0ABW5ZPI6_9BACL|nr:hypothetical protein [Jeotgalibacillus terrae]MBM7580495.1 hypothetical protein [Jeotgalibacillus terrae]
MHELILISAGLLMISHAVFLFRKRVLLTERYANTIVSVIAAGAGLTLSLAHTALFEGQLLWMISGISLLSGCLYGVLSGYMSAAIAGSVNGSIGSAMGIMTGEVLLNPALCGLPTQDGQILLPLFSLLFFILISLLILLSYKY